MLGRRIAKLVDEQNYPKRAENAESEYIAYVSEQNLIPDTSRDPVRHPQVQEIFRRGRDGAYRMKAAAFN